MKIEQKIWQNDLIIFYNQILYKVNMDIQKKFINKVNIIYRFIHTTKDFIVLLYMKCKKCQQQN